MRWRRFGTATQDMHRAVVPREDGDRRTNLGLCVGEAINHMLDTVGGLQAERFVRDMRDAERHPQLLARTGEGYIADYRLAKRLQTGCRCGHDGGQQAGDRPARQFVPQVQPL